ncbi:MAG: DsbA family protein [Ilumatobacteraceae bacterium]
MATSVRFWVDPICPWCWTTSQWIRRIAAEKDLEITWEPISLLVKNDTQPDSSAYERVAWTRGLLRVMESVRAASHEDRLGDLYTEFGRRIHHDGERNWDAALALEGVGLDTSHATAASDETWDIPLLQRMNEGLELVGDEVGTPIIAFRRSDGREVAAFGPVITRAPAHDDALALWDAFVTLTSLDEFWEIKRTRTVSPDVGDAP